MQSENRLFDDLAKMMCNMVRSFCQLKKMMRSTEQQPSQPPQEKKTSKEEKKNK